MSTVDQVAPNAAETPVPDPNPGPTITRYATLAEELIGAMVKLAEAVPQLEEAHAPTADFVKRHQNVSMEFLSTAVASVENCEELARLGILDPVVGRDHLQFIEAFRPVYDRMIALAENIKFTVSTRKAELTKASSHLYYHAKGLSKIAEKSSVGSFTDNMKRDLGRRGPVASPAVKKARKIAQSQQPKEGSAAAPVAGHA